MAATGVDNVLIVPPPTFTNEEGAALARDLFGVAGTAMAAESERDQTFLINGDRPTVLKISNAAEDPARLDLEAQAAQWIANVDPAIPVALPWPVPGSADYRAPVRRGGETHYARMYDRLPGRASVDGWTLGDDAVRDWGTMAARVGRALRGFFHPSASRVMLWDAQHALRLRPMLSAVPDAEVRTLVAAALDRYEELVAPVWASLRAQVVHTDLCASNVLVDGAGQVTGVIDFGDASWSALVVDLAAVLETVTEGREKDPDEFFRVARLVLDGYEKVTPLEPAERAIVGELIAARMCAAIVIPASRAALYDEPDALMADLRGQAVAVLQMFESLGWEEVGQRLGGSRTRD
jgi:Ser/Thr protein kinase RdoA (MazF antagonist)